MKYKVVKKLPDKPDDGFYLIHRAWNDWFFYETKYSIQFVKDLQITYLGTIKIAQVDMDESGEKAPKLPEEFDKLSEKFYSLGTDSTYYELIIKNLKTDLERESHFRALRDLAFDSQLYNSVKELTPFKDSLSRGLRLSTIEGRFRRLAHGHSEPIPFFFNYKLNQDSVDKEYLSFSVDSEREPIPTNVHAIIGRNGVGKSQLITDIITSLDKKSDRIACQDNSGDCRDYLEGVHDFFSKVVFVNFSIFENKLMTKPNYSNVGLTFIPISSTTNLKSIYSSKFPENADTSYMGRRKELTFTDEEGNSINPDDENGINNWCSIFMDSLIICFENKPLLWGRMMKLLYTDPIFEKNDCIQLWHNYKENGKNDFLRQTYNYFDKLSSGHKIVLLTLTKLIELSDEKMLVFIDEPELYLHPPLLSSFIRCLSELMKQQNGLAILATHSPVILQELPSECVNMLHRVGDIRSVKKPRTETFGQGISSLMAEVFSLETEKSGFVNIIDSVVDQKLSFEDSLRKFPNGLGNLGYELLLTKIYNRKE